MVLLIKNCAPNNSTSTLLMSGHLLPRPTQFRYLGRMSAIEFWSSFKQFCNADLSLNYCGYRLFNLKGKLYHEIRDASSTSVCSTGLKSRAFLSKPRSSAMRSAPYKSPYLLITFKVKEHEVLSTLFQPVFVRALKTVAFQS